MVSKPRTAKSKHAESWVKFPSPQAGNGLKVEKCLVLETEEDREVFPSPQAGNGLKGQGLEALTGLA